MFLFASSSFAEIPAYPHFTPMSLTTQPFASTSGIKVAGVYWLPDYLKGNVSRGSTDSGGGDIDGNCEKNYGMHTPSNIDSRYICSKYNYNVTSSLKCHVNCRCKDEYKYTSSNCSGKYTVSGGSCDGKYNSCSPKPCSDGGYFAQQQTNRICSAVTYGGRTCYSCKNDTCAAGYSKSSCGSAYHQTGSAKTEAGSTCYAYAAHNYSCPSGTQASTGGLIPPVAVSKTCSCGAKSGSCYKDGHSHSYSCPSGYSSTNSWGGSAQTTSKTCSCGATSGTCYKAPAHTHSYSCPSGSQSSSCSSSQVQTGTTSKVCSCGATSGNCYKCRGPIAGDILYSDGTISDSVIAGKTPVGIVAYVNGSTGFAVSLTEVSKTWSTEHADLPCLTNYTDISTVITDMNGKTNTMCMVNYNSNSYRPYPAAEYCNTYSAVSNGKGSGGWYLPAAGELYAMSSNYNAINLGLQKLSKTKISSADYWSSSEGDLDVGYYAWIVKLPSGTTYIAGKFGSASVRCILSF